MNNSLAPLMLTLGLTLLASCGKDSGGGSSSSSESPAIQEQQAEGSYRAILRPLNNSLSGYLPTGAAEIKISGDVVSIKTYLDDDARVTHIQNIHAGTRCPNQSDDRNGDGLIDINESMTAVGSVLIPLDSDINSASDGEGLFPMGGGFTYVEEASLSKLAADVMARTNQNLNLGGRAVLIHGVSGATSMPTTVSSNNELPAQATIPIACGIIQRQ
jgi:hypothetical protein